MGVAYNSRIITDGLVLALDAANTKSVPKTNILTTWVDYGGNQTNYEVLGAYSVKLKNTTTGWVGFFPATVSSTGKYVITFTYYSDSDGSSLVLDNDGIMENTYNTTLTVNITPQTYTGSVDVNTTGNIQHFFRRNGGGNIYVTNVSYFKLETTWTDLSGNGNTGTLVNGVGYSASNRGALTFDGVDDGVNIPHNSNIDIRNQITIECLFYLNSFTAGGPYTDRSTLITKAYSYYMSIGPSGKIDVYFYGTGGYFSSNSSVNLNQWTHVVVTFNGSTINWYINSIIDKSLSQSGTITPERNGDLGIGRELFENYGRGMNGRISNAKIYNRALSAAEISQNFNALRGRFGL